MAFQLLIHAIFHLIFSVSSLLADSSNPYDQPNHPVFVFSWLQNQDTYIAGDNPTIAIKILGYFDPNSYNTTFNPNVTVNDKPGNSIYISGLSFDFGEDLNAWTITFVPILVGVFNVLIVDENFSVLDSSLHFYVNPGPMEPTASIVSWMDDVNEFDASTRAMALVLPNDAYGNSVPTTNADLNSVVFDVSQSYADNNAPAKPLYVTCLGFNNHGYLRIESITSSAGDLLLHVKLHGQTLRGSPLPFKVHPGEIYISQCVAKWKYETSISQYGSDMEIFIYQHDINRNLVSGLYPFDAEIVEKNTKLSIPVPYLNFKIFAPGIQVLRFNTMQPGNFLLTIYDPKHNTSISDMPSEFVVSIGNCDGSNTVINGSGLNDSVAGQEARFSVYLRDAYQYPCPVELRMLQVHIALITDASMVLPVIYPLEELNGTRSGVRQHLAIDAPSHPEAFPSSIGTEQVVTDAYGVLYTPEKSGRYDILLLCGNIPLKEVRSLRKEVKAGEVNVSVSRVVKNAPKAQNLVKNEVIIQLLDSFSNPVSSQQSRLKLEIGSLNNSGSINSTSVFVDNDDGTYTGYYQVDNTGSYELCATFDGQKLAPCPCAVEIYDIRYFPDIQNDSVSVWEDQSIGFDVLKNDYFAGDTATIIGFTHPLSGSLQQKGLLFRYTPYKGFYGNDSFEYTLSDLTGNTATASVHIAVLSIPPQFLSPPTSLKASEDVMCPKFGGFHGIQVTYPDSEENISVILSAKSGTLSLSSMKMQFWEPIWSGFVASRDSEGTKALTLSGHVEVINMALQSIQYFGDANFYGDDTIQVSARNQNGATDSYITISVEPVNDPPFILTPEHIILEEDEYGGSMIYAKGRNAFEFVIGDPDLLQFPGNKSDFLVICSIEVTSGNIEAILPADLINTTELKPKNSYQWQPLQTFVTISNHLVVKARGLRFQATVDNCTDIVKRLKYHATEHAAVLTIVVNDMGNYGCFPDCTENVSRPLLAEVNVNLIKRSPLHPRATHALGLLIILEFLGVLSLGGLLLFYTCRCAISLIKEQRRLDAKKVVGSNIQTSGENTERKAEKEVAASEGSRLLLSRNKPLGIHQRSWHRSERGTSTEDENRSWPGREKNLLSFSIEKSQSSRM